MAHPKITQTTTFTDQYTELLQLSPSQILEIDELDYYTLRDNMFSINPDYDENIVKRKYFKALLTLLNDTQIATLREERKAWKAKSKRSEQDFGLDLDYMYNKFESLKLSPKKYKEFVDTYGQTHKTLIQQRQSETYDRKEPIPNYQDEFLILANQMLNTLLNQEQLAQFNAIEVKEKQELLDMTIQQVQSRYNNLKLNKKQAHAIFNYEEEEFTRAPVDGGYYSEFEKLALEEQFMASILDKAQLDNYQQYMQQKNEDIIASIIDSNQRETPKIQRLKNHKQYVINHFLPALCRWRSVIEILLPENVKEDIVILRQEYFEENIKIYNEHKAEGIRNYKDLYPNYFLKLELELQLRILIPNGFYIQKDISNFISKLTPQVIEKTSSISEELKAAREQFNQFQVENYENTGGTYGGWVHNIRSNDQKHVDSATVSSLLLIPNPNENIALMDFGTRKIKTKDH
ncbi:hypothetical protein [Aquimarina aggregata]|uniref:hypothetical protein n=1 Tax=Aquimarina aggregata TaxID=1642818 RepID=UPI00249174F4|nr:hypothetical protein [Aquimarina aggregata]